MHVRVEQSWAFWSSGGTSSTLDSGFFIVCSCPLIVSPKLKIFPTNTRGPGSSRHLLKASRRRREWSGYIWKRASWFGEFRKYGMKREEQLRTWSDEWEGWIEISRADERTAMTKEFFRCLLFGELFWCWTVPMTGMQCLLFGQQFCLWPESSTTVGR